MANIYFYDNNTGRNIPETLSGHKTTVLIGSTVDEIKENILPNSLGLCVFTILKGTMDFVVFSEADKNRLENILSLSGDRYNIRVASQSIWFSDKVQSELIISSNVDIPDQKLNKILVLFFNITPDGYNENEVRMVSISKPKYSTDYWVFNIRNDKPIIKVPRLDYAISVCDKNPCCVVKDSRGNIVHKSNYGKVTIMPDNTVETLSAPKESITEKGKRVAFNINK